MNKLYQFFYHCSINGNLCSYGFVGLTKTENGFILEEAISQIKKMHNLTDNDVIVITSLNNLGQIDN